MDNRTNTIAGWVLAGCGAALGLSIVGGMIFHDERPEKMGFPVEGVVEGDAAGGGAAEVPIATLLATADVAKGGEVFKKCAACHTVNQGGANGIGPNLWATLGEGIAQGKAGYPFSDALKGKGGNWTFDTMSEWLTSPRKFAPGTKMTFAGIGNGQDRANVIAYLNAQGSNLPLPAAPAASAAPAAGAAPAGGAAPAAAAPGAGAPAPGTEGKGSLPADPGGKASPNTDDLSNKAAPATGAPSIDPAAAARGAKAQ